MSGSIKSVSGNSGLTFVPRGNVEVKRQTANLIDTWSSVGTTAVYSQIATLGQGLDITSRLGRKIMLRDLYIEGDIEGGQSNLAADDPHNAIRIVVYRGTPTFSLIPAMGVDDFIGPEDNQGVIDVLLDDRFLLSSPGKDSTGYISAMRHVRYHVPLNCIQTYKGTAGSDLSGSCIYISMSTDSSVAPNPGFVNGRWLLTFTDM